MRSNLIGGAAIAALSAVLTGCYPFGQMGSASGMVADALTGQPLSEVQVSFKCYRLNLVHGSTQIRDAIATTGRDGSFFFVTIGCHSGRVVVSKPGYVTPDCLESESSQRLARRRRSADDLKEYHFLQKSEGISMHKLRCIADQKFDSAFELDAKTPSRVGNFHSAYRAFFESREIAVSEEERDFVRNRYCAELLSRYKSLTDNQRRALDKYSFAVDEGGSRFYSIPLLKSFCGAL